VTSPARVFLLGCLVCFVFFCRGSVLASPPPLEWFSFPLLVADVLITHKGAESPGSGRIDVKGAFSFFGHLRPFSINFTLPGRLSNALRHQNVVEHSEPKIADSVHARS